ncbi:KilA-N domain protein [Hydrogenophaga intermedia]|uniref:KilA-N domain protein n=1 Tax=Hydrogenophaga intermedia TaxID=65786 RepID=A0A1L1PAL7_HYDIT|nr:KilA-N domain-containing protein [Hydrogenophaga intermedia]CDN87052.1 KilA-N domain protein [Hydrogenophaga intermedia]
MNSSTALITRDYNGVAFQFRADGWFNMTKAAQHFGKDVRKFFANQETQEYLLALAANAPKSAQFIEARRGNGGGTWGHPKVAVPFSRWLDVRFSVWCDAMIEDIIKGAAELVITRPAESAVVKLPEVQTPLIPKTFREALLLAAEQEAKIEAQQKAIEEMKPVARAGELMCADEEGLHNFIRSLPGIHMARYRADLESLGYLYRPHALAAYRAYRGKNELREGWVTGKRDFVVTTVGKLKLIHHYLNGDFTMVAGMRPCKATAREVQARL